MNRSHALLAIAATGSMTAVAFTFVTPERAEANIGFARQSGVSCSGCHSDPSDPSKEALTRVGITFRTCLYNPTSQRVDCHAQAKNQWLANSSAATPPTSTPAPRGNAGRANTNSPFGNRNQNSSGRFGGSQQNTTNQRPPAPPSPAPAPTTPSNGLRDFLLTLLGAPTGTPANTQGTPGNVRPNTAAPVNQLDRIFVPPRGFVIGPQWYVSENLGNGRTLTSGWRKRPGTNNIFDASYVDSQTGQQTNDIVTYTGIRNGQITFRRQSTGTIYTGKLTPDGRMVLGGTTNQRARNLTWSGTNVPQNSGVRPATRPPVRTGGPNIPIPPIRTGGPYIQPAPPPAPPAPPVIAVQPSNNQNVQFRLVVSQKCLEVDSAQTANGTAIVQFQCDGSDEQSFSLISRSGGYFNIVAKHSGSCFDVPNNSTADNLAIQQFQCDGTPEQLFTIRDAGGGLFNLETHNGKCLEVPGGSTVDYEGITQFQCDGTIEQKFQG